jgi:AcrR family transcriptional regulator
MTTRGRPRDPSRDRAILVAARAVIARCGVTGATIEEIAKQAGVGKDTVYRRWSSKGALAIDLIDTLARDTVRPAPLEVDPFYNLFVYLKDVVRLCRTTDFGDLVAGIVGASARDGDVARCFRAFWERRRRLAVPLVTDITGADLDEERLATLLDRLFAPLYYRLLLTGADLSDEYLWELVTDTFTPHPGADLVGAGIRMETP